MSASCIVAQFALANYDCHPTDAFKKLKKYMTDKTTILQGTGWWKTCSDAVTVIVEIVAQGVLYGFLTEFLGVVKTAVMPVWDSAAGILSLTKGAVMRDVANSFAEYLIGIIREEFERLKNCAVTKSLTPLWGRNWDPERWLKFANTLITHKVHLVLSATPGASSNVLIELRKSGVLESDWSEPIPHKEFMVRLNDHIEQGRKLVEYVKDKSFFTQQISRLATFRDQTALEEGTNKRFSPFVVYLYGDAGVGKTVIMPRIVDAVRRKRAYDADGVYTWDYRANFQTGLTQNTWCINFDDPCHSVAPEVATVTNEVELLVKLTNNAVFPVEAAQVEMKGKLQARPSLIAITSNFKDMRVNDKLLVPTAFYRRVKLHVTVCVKPGWNCW